MMRHPIFLSRSYYPNIGGVEKHIYELSKILVSRGYKITIITEDAVSKSALLPEKDYQLRGVDVIRIPVGHQDWFKKIRIWRWIWENKELFIKADLTHCHDVFYWYLPIALLYPLKPVYTTFHGYEGYPIKFKAVIYRKVFEYMSNGSICVGEFMKKWYHANPTKVIYGAVNISKRPTVHPKKNSAIFIGRLDEHTGIDAYVQAVSLIRKKIPDFTLTVFGDGPLRDKIKKDGIIIKGENPYADKEISKYEYAFVSRYLAILEAIAAKRLVIAHYDNPIKKDYLVISPFIEFIALTSSPEKIVHEVLANLAKKEKMSNKTMQAFNWIKDYTWENLGAEYTLLWKKYEK